MRRRCSCSCPTHPPQPGTVQVDALAFPPLPEPLAGFLFTRLLADGTREVVFERYEAGTFKRQPELPTEVPESWRPAFAWAQRFLARTEVPA